MSRSDMRNCPRFSWTPIVRRAVLSLVYGLFLLVETPRTFAADEFVLPQASPEELGLRLPQVPPQPGGDRRVVVSVDGGTPTVGQVYLEVGEYFVVLLPSGQLIALPAAQAAATDRPFEPLDHRQLAKQLTAERFRGFETDATRHYLFVYNCSESFRVATSKILETMYPALVAYCGRRKLPHDDPPFPLVVVIFSTQKEFEGYRKMAPGLLAYYNVLSNQIVMFEQSELGEEAPELAFKQSVSTIAHEGVHQILHNLGVQQRLSRWPTWFSEGLAEYFAPTELARGARWKGVDCVNDLRLYELIEYSKRVGTTHPKGLLTRQTVQAKQLDSLGYAASWAMVHYFAKRERKKFEAYLSEVSQLEPLQSVVPGSLFAKHFGSDFMRLEESIAQHLDGLPYVDPIENQTHFVLLMQGRSRKVFVTSSRLKLQQYHREHANRRFARLHVFPNRDTATLFAQRWLQGR